MTHSKEKLDFDELQNDLFFFMTKEHLNVYPFVSHQHSQRTCEDSPIVSLLSLLFVRDAFSKGRDVEELCPSFLCISKHRQKEEQQVFFSGAKIPMKTNFFE